MSLNLTPAQFATLKAAIIADPVAGPLRLAQDTFSLLAWCNAPTVTDAWRKTVQPYESDEAATYTAYDSLLAGKRDSWSIFLRFQRDFTRAKVRNWIVDVWGLVIAASISETILKAGLEKETNAQLALGAVSRVTGTVTADDRNFTGQVIQAEVNLLVT